MNEEPEAPVEEARPDEEIDESERAYREMQKLFEELSFRERWRRMMAGLKMPHDTGEYKFARLQLQRLSGPAVAVAVPLITVIILLLLPRREAPPEGASEEPASAPAPSVSEPAPSAADPEPGVEPAEHRSADPADPNAPRKRRRRHRGGRRHHRRTDAATGDRSAEPPSEA